MDTEVLSWFLMALGVGELFFGIMLRQKGVNLPDSDKPKKKHGLIKAGTFVAVSGAVLVLIGIAVQKFGLP